MLKYQKKIANIKDVLRDYSKSDVFPKSVIYFFTSEIDHVIGTVSNELFYRKIPSRFNLEEYIDFIEKRKKELIDLKEEFFYGKI